MSIGTCAYCGCTDELIGKVLPGGWIVTICEHCAEDDRREHDDRGDDGIDESTTKTEL